MTYTIGSLFSGYGGLDLAVEQALGPARTRVADWPGTTVRWGADQCQTCVRREKRRGKVA